ncbi:hypothetical protein [Winogradskya humida]|uniref:Uncharacterized protein n=1 Tax=Winogradskya humida TaxID=113566 RepID=A0ABQ3ZQ87_9ACTN|nr:hypothetical protein [Actinoplanes humidus]GIE20739.1 hypothetical protein Ahu01nite_038410 [Actinoplanes humidus]
MTSSTDTPADLLRVSDALRNEFQRKMNTMRRQLDQEHKQAAETAETRYQDLVGRVDARDAQLAQIVDAYDEIRRQTDGELKGARQAIARLAGEVHLLEGRLRLEQGVQPVDLDVVPDELARLVAQVRAAEQLKAAMLDDAGRGELEAVLTAYTEGERRAAESRARAFEASRLLAGATVRSRAFRKAAAAYRLHWGQFRTTERELAAKSGELERAEAGLRRDAELHEAYRVQRGGDVVADLSAHLRRRVDIAVETHALFPAWFTITELGHRPSAGHSGEWRETATQVLLYRITYEITHGVLALGEAPAEGYQAGRHAEVLAALRRLDE